ncbi:MAG: trehalase family glycosidase [Herpetosiphon sp.]
MSQNAPASLAHLQETLPVPLLPNHSHLVELYWRAWEIGAGMVRMGTPENGFSQRYVDAAFGGNIFQWDTCFIAAFARYSSEQLPVLPALDNFYGRQDADGYMAREYRWENGAPLWAKRSGDSINPPLFSWAEWLVYRLTGDKTRLAAVWPHLNSYYHYLRSWHQNPDGTYWTTDMGSGMDNTPRFGAGWICFTAQQALNALTMSQISSELGNGADKSYYHNEWQSIAETVNKRMWDKLEGFYWDVDSAGMPVKNKTIASFWPLLAQIASPEQAERLVAQLHDPATFWRTHPFPTLAADHRFYKSFGDYWLGSVWAPTNYMVICGLEVAGYGDFAFEATHRHLEAMHRVYGKTGTLWENYRADEDNPGEPARPDFVGWTGCGPIALLIEQFIGIQIEAQRDTITWTIRVEGPHGIARLPFRDGNVDLSIDDGTTITVRSDRPLNLLVKGTRGNGIWTVAPGTQTLTLP